MRVPVAARGCPIALAPPFTFVRVRSSPNSRSTARYCGANASFTSTRSISASFMFALASALRAAGAGPIPMCLGSTPATAHATRRPSGFNPCAFAYSSLDSTVAAPPSEMPEAFPAVTSPSFLKYGFSPLRISSVVSGRMCSSAPTHDGGRWAHRLGPARQDCVRFTKENQLRALSDRLKARAAKAVDGDGRDFDREPGLESDVASHVDGVGRCLQRVSKNRMSEIAHGNAGALDGMAGRRRA